MRSALQFIIWPAIAGVLAAILILLWSQQHQGLPAAGSQAQQAHRVSFADAVQRAIPAVVNIYTSKVLRERLPPELEDPYYQRFLRQNNRRRERIQRSLGSGVIVSGQGLILTSRHIIDGADTILVRLHDGRTALAQVVGADVDTDLAVLKIDVPDIQAIAFGNPDQARVGDVVLAIGNPYGFGHSVSQGIISALGRYGLRLSTYEDFIQTDAAINEGNSGGALIDSEGRLLGINAATFSRSREFTGIGLATPVDLALGVTEDIVAYGKVIRGWMGLSVQTIFMTGSDNPSLLVTGLDPLGPAARSGVREGDIITHIDMEPVQDGRSTMNQIALLRPGDAVDLTLRRGDEEIRLNVVVGTKPQAGG
ncbi:MAG: trypsin-like peptidase domain-containing protein [Halieaceae bacterium]|jgi:serine protease DegS|nr:trypsin-like peptidase domain-containing protein [Halieaceae bacterium]